jgi:hypothetical protein
MASTSAEQQSSVLRPDRSTNTSTYLHSPQPYRRAQTGRISRNRASSALSFTELNRRALWEAATGRTYRSTPPEDAPISTTASPSLLSDLLAPASVSAAPSLSSSVSSAPSPPQFDIFPSESAPGSSESVPAVLGHTIAEESLE